MIHVRNGICRILVLLCAILVILLFSVVCYARENPDAYINWGEAILIHDFPQFTDAGKDYRGELPGKFGSQFPRMPRGKPNLLCKPFARHILPFAQFFQFFTETLL